MYRIFVSVCQQIRQDSFEAEKMDTKQQEHFVRLYDRFKDLLPFMSMYKPQTQQRHNIKEVDLGEVMDLPHMEDIKRELKSKIQARITFLPAVSRGKKVKTAPIREKLPWKQLYERSD